MQRETSPYPLLHIALLRTVYHSIFVCDVVIQSDTPGNMNLQMQGDMSLCQLLHIALLHTAELLHVWSLLPYVHIQKYIHVNINKYTYIYTYMHISIYKYLCVYMNTNS